MIRAYPALYEVFQSTPPARGATDIKIVNEQSVHISIHAPREGGDPGDPQGPPWEIYFNPRPPRGGRPQDRYARQHL